MSVKKKKKEKQQSSGVWFGSSVTEAAADGERGVKRWRMAERSCGCQGDGRCRMLHADNIKRERKKVD